MNNEIEAEILQVSIYCDIIKKLLSKHKELSIYKLIVFSYIAKKNMLLQENVYNAKTKKDIVYKCISLISGDYENFCLSFKYIIEAIHFLINSKKIEYIEYKLKNVENISIDEMIFEEGKFLYNAIEESKKMSDRQFMREVISNV